MSRVDSPLRTSRRLLERLHALPEAFADAEARRLRAIGHLRRAYSMTPPAVFSRPVRVPFLDPVAAALVVAATEMHWRLPSLVDTGMLLVELTNEVACLLFIQQL